MENDKIILIYQSEGLYEKNDKTKNGRLIPYYNYIFREYRPEMGHSSEIDTIEEGIISKDILDSKKTLHKKYYHMYFHIDNIFKNLMLNNLIDKEAKEKLKVHYNFLSGYIHPTKYNLEIWEDTNSSIMDNKDELYNDLISLYITKLMYLYIKIYIRNYKDSKEKERIKHYECLINELNEGFH